MLIWRGAGAVVIILGIASALLTNIATSWYFNETNYFARHTWAQASSLWIAAAASWFLGRYLNGQPPRIVRDKAGNEVTIKPNHDLMFIKVEYWGLILLVIGISVLVAGFLRR